MALVATIAGCFDKPAAPMEPAPTASMSYALAETDAQSHLRLVNVTTKWSNGAVCGPSSTVTFYYGYDRNDYGNLAASSDGKLYVIRGGALSTRSDGTQYMSDPGGQLRLVGTYEQSAQGITANFSSDYTAKPGMTYAATMFSSTGLCDGLYLDEKTEYSPPPVDASQKPSPSPSSPS